MQGGPTCFFQGKYIPCFFGMSPKASITTTLLTKMLKYPKQHGIYNWDVSHPFLLLDGHHSRMMLLFSEYINNPTTKWFTCFGVLYVMHIWQVNYVSSLNGAFKIVLIKAKEIKSSIMMYLSSSQQILYLSWMLSFLKPLVMLSVPKKTIKAWEWNPHELLSAHCPSRHETRCCWLDCCQPAK